jgi:hypothetical protein
MEQRENPEKTIAISNCVKQVENVKVGGYEQETGRLLGTPALLRGLSPIRLENFRLKQPYEGQVAVTLAIIQPVTDHEAIRKIEAFVL